MSILKNKLLISKLEVAEPHFKLLIDNKGNLLLPVAMPEQKAGAGEG